jgi:maleate isomerase
MSSDSVLAPAPADIRFDDGRHPRAKIGYVLLATEQTVQDDVLTLRPPGVGVHFTRAAIPDSITSESLAAQEADLLADCASTLLPDGSLDVVCYACTSGSLVIGEERVFAELRRGAPGAQATSLITGVIRALKTLQARRIVVATPYLDEVNQREVEYLEQAGFEVVSLCGLNLEKDSDMVRVAPDYIAEFALAQDVIAEIEARAGKPAICSNQAMIWDCLRLALSVIPARKIFPSSPRKRGSCRVSVIFSLEIPACAGMTPASRDAWFGIT